jgi:hypothetical protein
MMHHQYQSVRDIKFPDQRQYTKPGDLLLYNDSNFQMSIYRNATLMGTVHFSKSGLQEFIKLGWIKKPTEVNSLPTPPQVEVLIGTDFGFEEGKSIIMEVKVTPEGETKILDIMEVKGIPDTMLPLYPGVTPQVIPQVTPDERLVKASPIPKSRKPKKS